MEYIYIYILLGLYRGSKIFLAYGMPIACREA